MKNYVECPIDGHVCERLECRTNPTLCQKEAFRIAKERTPAAHLDIDQAAKELNLNPNALTRKVRKLMVKHHRSKT